MQAKASLQDDTPVPMPSNMTAFVTAHYRITSENSFLFWLTEFTGTYPLPALTLDVPASGVVQFDLDIPSNATSLDVLVRMNQTKFTNTSIAWSKILLNGQNAPKGCEI